MLHSDAALRSGLLPLRTATCLRAFLAIVGALAIAGCDDRDVREPSLWDEPVTPGERTWLADEWKMDWSFGGAADTLLHNPNILRAWHGGLLVWDAGSVRLHSFDRDGSHRWSFGSPGSGPDELAQVLDLQVGSRGQAFLNDQGNRRVTVVGPEGDVEQRIPLPGLPHSSSFAVLSDTLLAFVATSEREEPVRILDLEGRTVRRQNVPWTGFSELTSLSRQGVVAARGDRWVYAFALGNGWFPFRGAASTGFLGGYVEHLDFPRLVERGGGSGRVLQMVERPSCSACALSLTDSLVVIHFGGDSELNRRILDLHLWEDGRYLGSHLLPHAARRAVRLGDRVYTLKETPYPVLNALRLRPPPRR